jgi:hypothetical protein
MKNLLLIVVALCACSAFVAQSCLGPKVDDLALFKPAQLTWPAVENDLLRGIEDGVEDGDLTVAGAETLHIHGDSMEAALRDKDRDALRLVPWGTLEPWADRGIVDKEADGEIGSGVAASLREQLANFTTVITKLQGL